MILALRFIERDGKRILQMATTQTVEDGEVKSNWEDVPLEQEGGNMFIIGMVID